MAAAAAAVFGVRLRRRLAEWVFARGIYGALLAGRPPSRLALAPEDPWPGDSAAADRMFQGAFHFAAEEHDCGRGSPWTVNGASDAWRAELNGFAWLRHFEAAGGEAARRHARALVDAWLERHAAWDALAWRADVLARRLMSWLGHAGLLLDGADTAFQARLLDSLGRQARHLDRAAALAPAGAPRLTAAVALGLAALSLPGNARRWTRAAARLAAELAAQVRPDGGHVARSPSLQLAVLRDLVMLKLACLQAAVPVPDALQQAIDRMAPMLRFFRHGDGGLALFHGGHEEDAATIDLALTRADARGQPLHSAPHSGFERMSAERSLALVDVGLPPAPDGATPHAGLLAFEFSAGRERLIVNCGAPARADGEWARALAATAAHSTLVVADTNALAPGEAAAGRPRPQVQRNDSDGNVWLDASHDLYQPRFGLTHRRRLFLAATGDDMRGEDTLDGAGLARARGIGFAVRFHLHPNVHASLLQSGVAVLLKTAGGRGWRFRASGGQLSLEDSVYLGREGEQRRSQQIVVSDTIAPEGITVKWALSRVAPAA